MSLIRIKHFYHVHDWTLDDRDTPHVVLAGLHGVFHLGTKNITHVLGDCTSKRWHEELTHSTY